VATVRFPEVSKLKEAYRSSMLSQGLTEADFEKEWEEHLGRQRSIVTGKCPVCNKFLNERYFQSSSFVMLKCIGVKCTYLMVVDFDYLCQKRVN
jgi:hypothetical protein